MKKMFCVSVGYQFHENILDSIEIPEMASVIL